MNERKVTAPYRPAMINALAVVGFIALIGASMWLAIYSARFVPGVAHRVGGAAVYLSSVFTPSSEPTLSVVPTASSTVIYFDEAPRPIPPTTPKPVAPTAGQKTTSTHQISGTAAPAFSGLPDFIVTINAIGYLATASAESFLASSSVPADSRPAVNFTIKNIGTNVSGPWRWSASIPTQTAYLYQSEPQQALGPGDSIDYTLGFDQATSGADKMISITANFDHAVAESNPDNNSASAKITILGS